MAVPRRLDRRPPEQDSTRINERIGAPEVRLIDEKGQQVGVLKTGEALRVARERELDLVEVAPQARPPVCRILDYSKYKYEQAQKQKQARKHQQQITIREIKFRPKIAQHDYDTKKGHVTRFLLSKYKVKVTIMFRGREVAHPERGVAILQRLAEELTELAVVEQSPTLDGRNMAMLLAPSKSVLSGQYAARHGVVKDAEHDLGEVDEQGPATTEAQPALELGNQESVAGVDQQAIPPADVAVADANESQPASTASPDADAQAIEGVVLEPEAEVALAAQPAEAAGGAPAGIEI